MGRDSQTDEQTSGTRSGEPDAGSGGGASSLRVRSAHEVKALLGVSSALFAALSCGLCARLLRTESTAEDFARELDLDPTATARILHLLTDVGMVSLRSGRFSASRALRDWAAVAPFEAEKWSALWSHVPAFLRTGERFAHMDLEPESRGQAYSGVVSRIAALFGDAADALARALGDGGERILDVGAGSGVWSVAMAARRPDARIVAIDLPEVLDEFRDHAAARGLKDRVDTIAGDYHQVALPQAGFDRVILANVLHLEPEADAAALVMRTARALRQDGIFIIVDFFSDGSAGSDFERSLYALHLSLRAAHGAAHRRASLEQWLRDAGLRDPKIVRLDPSQPALNALVARK